MSQANGTETEIGPLVQLLEEVQSSNYVNTILLSLLAYDSRMHELSSAGVALTFPSDIH